MVAAGYASCDPDIPDELRRLRTDNATLTRETAHLREVNETQRAVIVDLKARLDAHKALRDNPHVTLTRKAVLEVAYETMGCPLGVSPATRSYPDTIISHQKIAEKLGVSPRQIGKHMTDLAADRLLKRQPVTSVNPENGKPVTHYRYAPVEGAAYVATLANPGALVQAHDPDASKLAAEAKVAKERRAKLVAARCPVCHTTDCAIHCANGHITPMDDVPDARATSPRHLTIVPATVMEDSSITRVAADDATDSAAGGDGNGESSTGNVMEDSSGSYLQGKGEIAEESSITEMLGAPAVPEASVSANSLPSVAVDGGSEGQISAMEDSSIALEAAIAALSPCVTRHPNGVEMHGGKAKKYLSISRSLTSTDIAAHQRGVATFGGGLLWDTPEGPRTQALVWDSDDDFPRLERSARRLDHAGLRPLLIQNPIDPKRGHLWVIFTAPCPPAWAIAAAERLAPELRALDERFPNLKSKDGLRIRLPGGSYVLPDGTRRPVKVAAGTVDGPGPWLDGTAPEAWALIGAAGSDPAILRATFVPRAERPQAPKGRPKAGVRQVHAPRGGGAFFAGFNAENPIESMVTVDRRGFFSAPWRDERTPSVHVYADGKRWKDFGPSDRGGDAFDLWCALNGYWDEGTEKPDRRAAYRALQPARPSQPPQPAPRRDPTTPSAPRATRPTDQARASEVTREEEHGDQDADFI